MLKIKCNCCEWEGNEEEIQYEGREEFCPKCEKSGHLMDVYYTEKLIIPFYTKNNYGVPTEYIKSEKFAKIFEELTKKKTINAHDRTLWKQLGIEFVEEIQRKI